MPFVPLPNSGQSLGQTRQQIKDNMDLLRSTIGNNHIDVNDAGAGDHKYCLFASQGSDPTTVAATPPGPIIALFNKSVTGVNRLYIRQPADGTVIQMTGIDPSATATGHTFLPGGLLLQWGFVNGAHGGDNHFNGGDTGAVTFNSAPNVNFITCLNVWTQPAFTGSNPGRAASIAVKSPLANSGFTWVFTSESTSYQTFYWWALGTAA